MYLKHLREVEKINNREADVLKKGLEEHRSVGEIHKHNKRKAFDFKLREKQHLIEQKNEQIHSKITGILADRNLRGHLNKSLSITESTDNLESVESK